MAKVRGPLQSQWRSELRTLLRNGEQLLLTLVIPIGILAFFSKIEVLASGDPEVFAEPVDFLTPGVLALAVMSSAMVSTGIATGFERGYKVLKRLGTTPLGRPRWLMAKVASILCVLIIQFAILIPVAIALGWDPGRADWPKAAAAVALGTSAFAGLGLFFAGRLRAEINLAVQNLLFLVLLVSSGMVIPLDELPDSIASVARFLPSGALADILRDSLVGGGTNIPRTWLVLIGWAVVAPLITAITFRWE
ncbi:MAG: ABC transporter permease [Actinomycetota bacterium]